MSGKDKHWKWIRHEGSVLLKVGVDADGSLWNPNGYPDETVQAAIAGAEERLFKRHSEAAKKAAVTRQRRRERKVYEAANRLIEGHVYGPRDFCFICGKGLGDPQSIERGIGSDCWQAVLTFLKVSA